ncbi:cell division protein ZapA [Thiopseudomonas alkaliphila]|uniref:cell division protein ZapA n=1 Tax=Thiopseudomonas alkaliphila TaxID=1697053 RepID=UPI002578018A|nr:cell division protein ZapA [Thiopseudomonas alkaliphila]MDM1707453.1 cell division protein ZapA [Thiopseudomonas alkaliphila]
MTSKQKDVVKIQILDKDYHVACEAQIEPALTAAAAYLDQKMREIRRTGRVMGTERIAVMAALNMAYELQSKQGAVVENFPAPEVQSKIDASLHQVTAVLEQQAKKA